MTIQMTVQSVSSVNTELDAIHATGPAVSGVPQNVRFVASKGQYQDGQTIAVTIV